MQTRREQVRAYRFVNRRMVSALLTGDPENQDLPMRRLGLAIFGSVMVALIVMAGVAIYGVYNPGGGKLTDHTLLIERETGANYVFLGDTLYPVLNYASARLIMGDDTAPQQVAQATLRGQPRGQTLGIPGAPNALPAANSLISLPWSVCGASTLTGTPATQLMIGRELAGGAQLGESSLLVQANGTPYLIWHNHRLQTDAAGLAALEITTRPVPMGPAVLNAMDAGPPLLPLQVPGNHNPTNHSYNGKPANVGDVFKSSQGQTYYVLLADGFAPISQVSERLLRAGLNGEPPTVTPLDIGAFTSRTQAEPVGSPATLPVAVNADPAQTALCASYRGGSTNAAVTVEYFAKVPAGLSTAPPTGGGSASGVRTADRVVLDGGRGAIVQTLSVAGADTTGTTVYLVTDEGIKYPLSSAESRAALGYGGVTPVLVPAALLALLPSGPILDKAAARLFTTRTS